MYSASYVFRIIKSRKARLEDHVACLAGIKSGKIQVRDPKVRACKTKPYIYLAQDGGQ